MTLSKTIKPPSANAFRLSDASTVSAASGVQRLVMPSRYGWNICKCYKIYEVFMSVWIIHQPGNAFCLLSGARSAPSEHQQPQGGAPETFAPVLVSPDLTQLQNCFTRFELQTQEQTLSIASNKLTWAENCSLFSTVSRPWFSILAAACLATMALQANYNGFKHTTLTRLWPQTSNFK